MAVSIDTVYQRVLTLANKEQRGYITPQEFNLLANHAQMEMFERYFYDIDQFNKAPGNINEYSELLEILDEKISIFEVERGNNWMTNNMTLSGNGMLIPDEIYRIGTVRIGKAQVEILNSKDFDAARSSAMTAPSLNRPIGYIIGKYLYVGINQIDYNTPGEPERMNIRYVRRPDKVEWAYVVVNDKPLYNANISKDFELHQAEETELVYKILKLAGINLKAQEIVQVGQTLEAEQVQQEKQ
tara:strand:+ start:375 stop:1100 length:726 start_codon:yes stop_codon:yes gene_type:complete